MDDKGKYIKRTLRNVGKTAVGSAELMAGIVGLVTVPVVGVPLLVDGTQRMLKGIRGEYIKDSMINVMSNNFYSKTFHGKENRIIQEFPNIKQFVTAFLVKDKMNFLLMQELNFLLGSDTFNKEGEKLKYTTHSQSLTKMMLTRLQRTGMIENLTSEETKPKALLMERLMLGNEKKGLFKKDKMYEMSFSKTDRQITEEDISKFLKIDITDDEKFYIKRDKDNNIISVNYRTSKLIKDKFNKMKDKLLPSKDIPKMLSVAQDTDKSESNERKLGNIIDDKNTLSNDLKNLVNKPEEIIALKTEIDNKELDTQSR